MINPRKNLLWVGWIELISDKKRKRRNKQMEDIEKQMEDIENVFERINKKISLFEQNVAFPEFRKYMEIFEQNIVVPAYQRNQKVLKDMIIPINGGKLRKTRFGEFIGSQFESHNNFAINYYGYFKLSSKIVRMVDRAKYIFGSVKTIKTKVIYFNSDYIINEMDNLIKFPDGKTLYRKTILDNYSSFKDFLINLRWKEL